MNIDHGHNNFLYIHADSKKLKLSDANEAETRKNIIDNILEKILGWDPNKDICYEEKITEDHETKYADYLIKTATTSIVIEAKRVGKAFELNTNRTTGVLGGVLSEGEIGKAIRQVRDYARKLSVPFAVVTNGSAWIIFPAVRVDGVTFEQTQARIFRDLDDIKNRFVEFWELLSRQRVVEGNLENSLFGSDKDENKRRLISIVKEPGYRLGRNRIYEYIEKAVILSLTDEAILDDIAGLSYCYVKNSERVKYDSRLKMYLADVKPQLERKVVRLRHRSKTKHLDDTLVKTIDSRPQFLLILGPVGAGKTTFLRYTSEVSAKEIIKKNLLWIYIDFKSATEVDDPRKFLYSELLKYIENDVVLNLGSWDVSIKVAYKNVIDNLTKGPLSLLYEDDKKEFNKEITRLIMKDRDDVEPFVNTILKFASKKRPIFFVVDNIDQLESEEHQRKIFNEAQAIARRINSNVILSLRESTYLKHRNTPVFDAFQVDSIYIDPPNVTAVLSRRFAYAKKILDKKNAEIISESGIRFKVPDLSVFFGIVSSSFLTHDTGFLLESLAGGDIRRGLKLVREFLASGHTSADKALQTFLTDGKFKFPRHEVFKGALLGQRKYYKEEESLLLNIYDSKLMRQSLQLLRFQTLYSLVNLASDSSFEGLAVEEIESDLYRVGVANSEVISLINDLIKFGTIKTTDGNLIQKKSKMIPTRFGGYLIRKLCYEFMYLEPCLIDACIFDNDIWENLVDLTEKIDLSTNLNRIKLRIERAKVFFEYLSAIERTWVVECKRFKLTHCVDYEIISKEIFTKVQKQLKWVERSARNQYK